MQVMGANLLFYLQIVKRTNNNCAASRTKKIFIALRNETSLNFQLQELPHSLLHLTNWCLLRLLVLLTHPRSNTVPIMELRLGRKK